MKTIKVALYLRWLTTKKFQNYETAKGDCIPSKNKFKTQTKNKLRRLASTMNVKLPNTGCPIAYALTVTPHDQLAMKENNEKQGLKTNTTQKEHF